jgi:hypothetical protein
MSSSPSIFTLKMALTASSPRKRSTTQGFKVSVVNTRKAGRQHATKWLTATGACKVESILSGATTAALLTVAKLNKINTIFLAFTKQVV